MKQNSFSMAGNVRLAPITDVQPVEVYDALERRDQLNRLMRRRLSDELDSLIRKACQRGHAGTAEEFSELLVALGFVPVAQVRKRRRTFHLDWQGHPVEVALDEVAGLGHFVELELSASEATLDGVRAALASLAARLELADSERRSYLELLLERR